MPWTTVSIVALCSLVVPSIAGAEIRNYVIKRDGGQTLCEPREQHVDQQPGELRLVLRDLEEKLGDWKVTYARAADGVPQDTSLTGGSDTKSRNISLADIRPGSTIALAGSVDGKTVACKDEQIVQSGLPQTELDDAAARWLLTPEGATARRRIIDSTPGHPELIVHLPSGRLAASNPASLREDSDYQLTVIVDRRQRGWLAEVNVTTCPARDPNRLLGTIPDVDAVALQAGEPSFDLLPVERALQCGAGTAQYMLRVSRRDSVGQPVQTSWRVRPVYRFATAVSVGFDFGKTSTFGVANQTITETRETLGPTTKVGLIWFPKGVDFEEMRWYNHVLNPFLLFDLDAPKEAFAIGTTLTPTGGIAIAVGASFRKSTVLDGAAVGAAFEGDGAPKTTKRWNKDSAGFYLGITLDDKIYTVLKGIVPAGKKGS